jgi:hypothetical protein
VRPAKSMSEIASTRMAIEKGIMPDVRVGCIGESDTI